LKAGSKVTVDQVIATIVDPSRLQIRVDLDEKQFTRIKPGAQCKVVVRAFADNEQKGTVKSVSAVPYAGSKYDCVVSIRPGKNAPAFLPTMGCDLEFAAKDSDKDKAKKKSPAKATKSKKDAGPEKPAK
jgi:multidrug efflux pump subunit AcrA (membrane-fusion protein)